ncbi:MAG: hypothetical protein DMG57_02400 [Acidobacteria bacterium]|nr:MAG: hypothetical protein DMG57_02400 [Acidobacteriota bacterium]
MRFACLLLSVCLVCPRVDAQEKLQQAYQAAQQLFLKGDDTQARAAFSALLAETFRERAAIYRSGGSWLRVRDDLQSALDLEPLQAETRFELAYALFRLESWPQAAQQLEPLVREKPNEARFHGLLGRAYLSMGKPAAARQQLAAALRLEPDNVLTAYTLALAALSEKDRIAAARVFSDLEKRQNSPSRFHVLVGRAYLDAGFQQEAQQELTECLKQDPKARFARYLLALSYVRELEEGGITAAKKELAHEVELFPEEFAAHYLLGLLVEHERRWDDAARQFEQSTQLALTEPDPWFHLGAVYLKLGRACDAAHALERSLKLAPEGSPARYRLNRSHYLLSQAYKALGDTKAAAREAQAAREASVASTGQDRRLLEELSTASVPEITVSWQDVTKTVPLTPSEKELLSVFADVLLNTRNYLGLIAGRQHRFADAAKDFASVRSTQPNFPHADFNLGLALFQQGEYAQALEPLERAAGKMAPAALTKILGLVYFQNKQYEKAVTQLEQARKSHSDDPQVLMALGTSLVRLGRKEEARRSFEDLLKSQPDTAPLHILWGEAYAEQSQPRQAEQEFQRALELDPQASSAHFDLGKLYLKKGQMDQAGLEFRAELQSHPGDTRSQYHLAFVLLSQQRTAEAIPLLRQVIASKPDYAEARYSLGKALLQRGETAAAIEQLEASVKLDASKSYSHYQLGRAYIQAGRREEAQREFALSQKTKQPH